MTGLSLLRLAVLSIALACLVPDAACAQAPTNQPVTTITTNGRTWGPISSQGWVAYWEETSATPFQTTAHAYRPHSGSVQFEVPPGGTYCLPRGVAHYYHDNGVPEGFIVWGNPV